MPLQFNPIKLFAGSGTAELAENIAANYGSELGDVVLSRFSDGEFQPHFNESVRGLRCIFNTIHQSAYG